MPGAPFHTPSRKAKPQIQIFRVRSSMCRDEDQKECVTNLYMQDFSYEEVKDTIDSIYSNLCKKEVEIDNSEVVSVLGIEGKLIKPRVKKESSANPMKIDLKTEGIDVEDFIKSEMTYSDHSEEEGCDENIEGSSSQSLESLNVIKYHDYTGTRREFWEEHFVKEMLEASFPFGQFHS